MQGGSRQAQGTAGAEALDWRRVALMRCLLAAATLLFFVLQDGTVRLRTESYALLGGYFLYCLALYGAALSREAPAHGPVQYWLDVAVYGTLVMLSAGATPLFVLLFFFAILVASFSRGLRAGLAVSAVSALIVAAVSLADAPGRPELNLVAALQQPAGLLLIGATMAWWGARELAHRGRVELMRDVASLVNPRLGLDHAVSHSLRRLREYFGAQDCILVCARTASREPVMFRVDAVSPVRPPRPLTEESTQALLALEAEASLVWRARRRPRPGDEELQRLANLLDARCFATVPFPQREGPGGRLYLTGGRCRASAADLEFLRQVSAQIGAAVDNLALIEHVMENAAKLERARISRDIHDTTLQPYIGLKLGLEALARKLPPGSPIAAPLAELLDMSTQVIGDLRGYVARLRGEDAAWPGEHLLSGLREHVGRYRSFYGIEVELRSAPTMRVTDRVAGEAYQIVCEALSNIHRHTPAKRAFVELRCDQDHLAIEVGNECRPGADSAAFVPRSIAERAAALGGRADVELRRSGHDVVRVAIPL